MEAVLFIGLPGSGKSTFYKERFYDTHLRLNLDMLKTRHRERLLLLACIDSQTRFVVDNTNVTRSERKVYIDAARAAGYRVVGYFFRSYVEECLKRNDQRQGARRLPLKALLGFAGRMERPSLEEGFDEIHYVRIDGPRGFVVEAWRDEDGRTGGSDAELRGGA